jgi:hypothetical protein
LKLRCRKIQKETEINPTKIERGIVKLTERALLIADPGETQIKEYLIDFHTLFTQSRIWHKA